MENQAKPLDYIKRSIIKELGLKFRGENNWIFYRSMNEGKYPWFLNFDKAELMIEVLQKYIDAIASIIRGEIEVDFDSGEMLLHYYSESKEKWESMISFKPMIKREILIYDDENILREVKASTKSTATIELDQIFLPMPIQEKKDDIPYMPQLVAVIDCKSGACVMQEMLNKEVESQCVALEMLISYIASYGRPKRIFVRNDRVADTLEDFCNKTEIKLSSKKGMPLFNKFSQGLLGFLADR
ncbi:MAG: DUF6930 domain-containing protein [Anaerovoracaceae bacterium]